MACATGDPAWDAILTATLDCVGELSYEAATIDAIDAAGGYTHTVIFTRYRTKQDLFIDATDRIMGRLATALRHDPRACAPRRRATRTLTSRNPLRAPSLCLGRRRASAW